MGICCCCAWPCPRPQGSERDSSRAFDAFTLFWESTAPLPFMEMTRGLVAEKSNQSTRDSPVFVLFEGFHHCP
jgi:hypothetical protein